MKMRVRKPKRRTGWLRDLAPALLLAVAVAIRVSVVVLLVVLPEVV